MAARALARAGTGRAALPLPGSDGNQLDGFVAFICWRAAFGGRASCCAGSAWPEIRWPPNWSRRNFSPTPTAVVPGQPFTAGLLLKMAPGWHTYWQFPGDAGIPTEIKWQLPPGWKTGPIQWPIPLKLNEPGDIQIYGYHDEVLLMMQLTPPAKIEAASVKLAGRSELARLREDLHPRQRQGAARSARRGASRARQCGALHEIPRPPPAAAPAECGQRITAGAVRRRNFA